MNAELLERLSLAIARGHSGRLTYQHPVYGWQSVASQGGFGQGAEAIEKYARARGKDYQDAAKMVVEALPVIAAAIEWSAAQRAYSDEMSV
jgi:hypothetical protein